MRPKIAKFTFFIALRYLFSKKEQRAVNLIALLSASGIALCTIALVCVLSVFNGFESLVKKMFSHFDPDLKIEAKTGKVFSIENENFAKIRALQGVDFFCPTLEDDVLLSFQNQQTPARVKGVDENFLLSKPADSLRYQGKMEISTTPFSQSIIGAGLAYALEISSVKKSTITIFAPKRTEKISLATAQNAFTEQRTAIAGLFAINQPDIDNRFLLAPIEQVRALLGRKTDEVSAVELKISKNLQSEIQEILGENFTVKNRYQQQENLFRIMKIEKWVTFLILIFILIIATFNIIGSLTMLLIEKKSDLKTLQFLGCSQRQIKRIFLLCGWLISLLGSGVGLVIGLAICLSQQFFGWIKLSSALISDTYPVEVQLPDLIYIAAAVLSLGLLAAYFPVRKMR